MSQPNTPVNLMTYQSRAGGPMAMLCHATARDSGYNWHPCLADI